MSVQYFAVGGDSCESNEPMDACKVDLASLKLRVYAEFDTWDDFVDAVDEFQKKTFIKLTIITSKKLKNAESESRKRKSTLSEVENDDSQTSSPPSTPNMTPGTAKHKNRARFEYQYLKLTCKHFGKYTSTSKGIRPNQKTAKLECPTFLYASYDHYKDKFIIKQMLVNCNHELKDEDVSLPKLLQRARAKSEGNGDITPVTYEVEPNSGRKKYIKVANRNILKIPLESPTPGALIMSVQKRIKCNHEINSICQAASLTNEDLLSIHAVFADKGKPEQNALIIEWITLNNYENAAQLTPNKLQKHMRSTNSDSDSDTVLIQFKLPTFDGSLINVCFKAFMSILNISSARVNEVICDYYSKNPALVKCSKEELKMSNGVEKNREIEASVATILTSFNSAGQTIQTVSANDLIEVVEGENQQVMIIDTVDVPTSDHLEDAYANENKNGQLLEEVVGTSTVVPVVINDARIELNSFSWWRQVSEESAAEDFYCKIEPKRRTSLLNVNFSNDNFTVEVYNQLIDSIEYPFVNDLLDQYTQDGNKADVLTRLDELAICRGISDPALKQMANQIKCNNNQIFTYCFYSDSVRSIKCRLLYGEEWSYGICRECYAILDNAQPVHIQS